MTYTIKCADCGKKATFSARTLRRYYDIARDNGWAVSADYTKKWCPHCAPLHRNVGRGGVKQGEPLPEDWKQLKIENI